MFYLQELSGQNQIILVFRRTSMTIFRCFTKIYSTANVPILFYECSQTVMDIQYSILQESCIIPIT